MYITVSPKHPANETSGCFPHSITHISLSFPYITFSTTGSTQLLDSYITFSTTGSTQLLEYYMKHFKVFHGMEKVHIPWRHTPLAAGFKGQVGADCMGPIPNQHCCVMSGEGLRSLCYNGGFCSQSRSARIPSKREWMQNY